MKSACCRFSALALNSITVSVSCAVLGAWLRRRDGRGKEKFFFLLLAGLAESSGFSFLSFLPFVVYWNLRFDVWFRFPVAQTSSDSHEQEQRETKELNGLPSLVGSSVVRQIDKKFLAFLLSSTSSTIARAACTSKLLTTSKWPASVKPRNTKCTNTSDGFMTFKLHLITFWSCLDRYSVLEWSWQRGPMISRTYSKSGARWAPERKGFSPRDTEPL